jgi:N6-L-threonylcarbamoyladenine synthase
MAEAEGLRLIVPPPVLCTDNAAMIAAAGFYRMQTELSNAPDSDTFATEALG